MNGAQLGMLGISRPPALISKNAARSCLLILGLTVGLSQACFAQDRPGPGRVTLYGIADTGVEMVTNVGDSRRTAVRMPSVTGSTNSRWGIKGQEPLGGSLKTVFTLEGGLNLRDGSLPLGKSLFGRQAWMGLQGHYGALTLGRQYTMTILALRGANLLGPDIYTGIGSFDSYIPSRNDNAIVYKGTWHGFTAGASFSFARDMNGSISDEGSCAGGPGLACHGWSAMLRYDAERFGVSASYEQQRGGPEAAASFLNGVPALAFTDSSDTDTHIQLNGHYAAGAFQIGGGWMGRWVHTSDAGNATPNVQSHQFFLTAAYHLTSAVTVDGGVFRVINHVQDARGTILVARTTYAFSKRTAVYGQAGYLFNSARATYELSQGPGATPPMGANQLGLMVGLRHAF
jgi:predicted porin